MRYITDAPDRCHKILDDVNAATVAEAVRARSLGMRVRTPTQDDRKPAATHVVNWVLARYFAMPEAERDRFLAEGKAETDWHLEHDRIVTFEGRDWSFAGPVADGPPDSVEAGADDPVQVHKGRGRGPLAKVAKGQGSKTG